MYRVYASVGEKERLQSPQASVCVLPEVQVAPIVLKLAARRELYVLVHLPTGDVSGAGVYAWLLGPGAPGTLDPARFEEDGLQERVSFNSQEIGEARYLDVAPGTYLVGASRGGVAALPMDAMTTVTIEDAPVEVELELPPLSPEHFIACRCVGADDEIKIMGVEVSWSCSRGSWSARQSARDADGCYRVYVKPPPTDAERVEFKAHAETAGREAAGSAEWTDPTVRAVEIKIERLAELSVTVEGPDGMRAIRAGVLRLRLLEGSIALHADSIGEDRHVRVRSGRNSLSVRVKTEGDGPCWEVERMPIELVPGINKLAVAAPRFRTVTLSAPAVPAGTLAVLSLDRVAGACVVLGESSWDEPRGSSATAEFDTSGQASFELVPDGLVTVTVWDPSGPGAMRFAVAGDCRIEYAGKPLNAFWVVRTVSWSDGEHSLEGGDALVGVDGARFESYADLTRLAQSTERRNGLLMVLHGGALRTVPWELELLAQTIQEQEDIVPVRLWSGDE
jgi:hypothetical protein